MMSPQKKTNIPNRKKEFSGKYVLWGEGEIYFLPPLAVVQCILLPQRLKDPWINIVNMSRCKLAAYSYLYLSVFLKLAVWSNFHFANRTTIIVTQFICSLSPVYLKTFRIHLRDLDKDMYWFFANLTWIQTHTNLHKHSLKTWNNSYELCKWQSTGSWNQEDIQTLLTVQGFVVYEYLMFALVCVSQTSSLVLLMNCKLTKITIQ